MSSFTTDRNLLIGVLGLQMELISQSQLITAMQTWVFHKSVSLEDLLLRQKAISAEACEFLAAMAEKHIALHHNDAAESLASLSSIGPVRKQLEGIEDSDLSHSMERLDELRGQRQADTAILPVGTEPETLIISSPGTIGSQRFRILRPHAKGGLGQVSVAEDTELHREVALKEIQPDYSNDPASRNRFMIEAEVTGQLEHPGIVPVYSLGRTASGAPFYVMRFIKGDSLKEAITQLHQREKQLSDDEWRLCVRRLLRRLVDVCNAIEYAHSRGVLHRDLKPGNIMLGKYGETLVVDWGLAKTNSKTVSHQTSDEATFVPLSTDGSTETRAGTIVGTLRYMSPEQADGRLDALGPVSDVYSLGATLYCILTGTAPIPKMEPEEMLNHVRRGMITPPRQKNPRVPPSLEAVCLKAMSRIPSDRYPTAAAFAEELELWLSDEPVTAFPEPITDRSARFVRRHRTVVGVAGMALASTVVALLIVNSLVRSQNAELQLARDDADRQRLIAVDEQSKAEGNRKLAVAESRRAEDNLTTARSLLLEVIQIAEEKLTGSRPDIPAVREALTERAYSLFSQLHAQNPEDSVVAFEFSKAARISANLKRFLRDFAIATARLELSLKLQQELPADQRTTRHKDYLAETFRDLGTLRKAEGKLPEASDAFRLASDIVQQLVADEPDNPLFKRSMAAIELEQIGLHTELLELESALQKSISCAATYRSLTTSEQPAATDHVMLLLALARHGRTLDRLKRHDEARPVYAAAIAEGREWRTRKPDDRNLAYSFARLLHWSAESITDSTGPTDAAVAELDESLKLWEELAPASAGYRYYLGDALRVQGNVFRLQMNLPDSEASLLRSKEILEAVVKQSDTADNKDVLADSLRDLAATRQAAGDKAAALDLLQQAVALETAACALSPTSRELQESLTHLQQRLTGIQ